MQKDSRRGLTTHIAWLKIHDHREFLICYELTVIINLGHCVPGLVVQINREKSYIGLDLNQEVLGFYPLHR